MKKRKRRRKRAKAKSSVNTKQSDQVNQSNQSFASRKSIKHGHKNATTDEVKGAISMLASIPTDELIVKRKFKVASGHRRAARWWFVLRAEERILKKLEETWSSIALL